MKNQNDYLDKIIRILKELKRDHPDVDISKHYSLATDCSDFTLSDKELFLALQKHQSELEMNTLCDKDLEKVIKDTDELFLEVESEDEDNDWFNIED